MTDLPGNGAAEPSKREPFIHLCHCGAWGSFGHDTGTKDERWYCREHDPAQGKGSRGLRRGDG